VGSVRADEVVDGVVRIDRLAGVAPEAVDDVVLHLALADVVVVHVGDLELPAARGHERLDDVEDIGVVEIDAGDGELARRRLRLLENALHTPVAGELRNAEMAKMLDVAFPREVDARTAFLLAAV